MTFMSFTAECRQKIADLNVRAMGDNAEWDTYGREVFDLVQRMADEIERLSVPAECTDEMAHAMSRLDGYDRDRDMPGLQQWKDYWDAAVAATRLRWVSCEACGGSGETIRVVPTSTFEAPHEYPENCATCEGTGRDCVTVTPITVDDLDKVTAQIKIGEKIEYDSAPTDPHHGGKIWNP